MPFAKVECLLRWAVPTMAAEHAMAQDPSPLPLKSAAKARAKAGDASTSHKAMEGQRDTRLRNGSKYDHLTADTACNSTTPSRLVGASAHAAPQFLSSFGMSTHTRDREHPCLKTTPR